VRVTSGAPDHRLHRRRIPPCRTLGTPRPALPVHRHGGCPLHLMMLRCRAPPGGQHRVSSEPRAAQLPRKSPFWPGAANRYGASTAQSGAWQVKPQASQRRQQQAAKSPARQAGSHSPPRSPACPHHHDLFTSLLGRRAARKVPPGRLFLWRPGGIRRHWIWPRSLPFTCTTSSRVSRFKAAGSGWASRQHHRPLPPSPA